MIAVGISFGLSDSEDNPIEDSIIDDPINPQNDEGKHFTIELSDSVQTAGP